MLSSFPLCCIVHICSFVRNCTLSGWGLMQVTTKNLGVTPSTAFYSIDDGSKRRRVWNWARVEATPELLLSFSTVRGIEIKARYHQTRLAFKSCHVDLPQSIEFMQSSPTQKHFYTWLHMFDSFRNNCSYAILIKNYEKVRSLRKRKYHNFSTSSASNRHLIFVSMTSISIWQFVIRQINECRAVWNYSDLSDLNHTHVI